MSRPSVSRKSAAAPFSPAAAKLIAQVQADAREQLLNDLSAKDAIVVLHGFDAETKRVRVNGSSINIRDDKGNYVSLQRLYQEPASWVGKDYMAGYWNPSLWYGHQTLVDASGTQWSHEFNPHVCDDFGNLVEVRS
jgi:hypothetical protein